MGEAELAVDLAALVRLLGELVDEGVPVGDRVGVGGDEAGQREHAGERQPERHEQPPPRLDRLRERRDRQRHDDDPAGVLRGGGQAEAEPRDRVVPPAARAQDRRRCPTATGTPVRASASR